MSKAKEVKLDEWQTHVLGCKQCRQVDITKPVTLVACCILGAPHLRDHLAAKQAPKVRAANLALKQAFTGEHHCSKKKMKEQMRYVEPQLI